MNNLIHSIEKTLEELTDVVSLMNPEDYSKPLILFSGSSVGMHARHILEFYQCLMLQSCADTVIDYEKRQRDLLLQTSPDYFIETVESLLIWLSSIDANVMTYPLSIRSEGATEKSPTIASSLARELQYNLEHTIHHSAFIKIGILSLMPDVVLPPTFGIAPSTLRYRMQKN